MSVKQYDRTELLDRAIELFRLKGYSATSTAELVEELGVNRKSMYAEFGSKQGLFEAALERYARHHLSAVLAPIESPDADADSIREAFEGYASASGGWARGRGVFYVTRRSNVVLSTRERSAMWRHTWID